MSLAKKLALNRCTHLYIVPGAWISQTTLIARFVGPTWGPSVADRTQVGPMLAPWTLLSGKFSNIASDRLAANMMTSSNGNIFRVTGPLRGGFTGQRLIPAQRPVTRNFGVFFDLRLNKLLSKQSKRRWFETPSRSLWRHCNGTSQSEAMFENSCKLTWILTRRFFSNTDPWTVLGMIYLQSNQTCNITITPCYVETCSKFIFIAGLLVLLHLMIPTNIWCNKNVIRT